MLPKHYFKGVVYEPEPEPQKNKFEVYGVITTKAFQLSKCYVEKLHSIFPREYDVPYINPMLDLDWFLFLTKMRREIGGEKLWSLKKQVIVFKNSDILGDDDDLLNYVAIRYKMSLHRDYEGLGVQQLIKYIQQQKENGNVFVYLMISVDNLVIGSMLFEIYAKTVPELSHCFIKYCTRRSEGYASKPIQRIVRPSWIQCGGWHPDNYRVSCENYIIPHNKRGVLSMCNNGKHTDNYSQFLISLEPTPWMDYKYVAFGQLIYGESVLHQIENIPTHYEEPKSKVTIIKCGVYDLCSTFDKKNLNVLDKYLSKNTEPNIMHHDVVDVRDVPSILLRSKYLKKYYCAQTDKRSYLPLQQLPSHLLEGQKLSCRPNTNQTAASSVLEDERSQEVKTSDLMSDDVITLQSSTKAKIFRKFLEPNKIVQMREAKMYLEKSWYLYENYGG